MGVSKNQELIARTTTRRTPNLWKQAYGLPGDYALYFGVQDTETPPLGSSAVLSYPKMDTDPKSRPVPGGAFFIWCIPRSCYVALIPTLSFSSPPEAPFDQRGSHHRAQYYPQPYTATSMSRPPSTKLSNPLPLIMRTPEPPPKFKIDLNI